MLAKGVSVTKFEPLRKILFGIEGKGWLNCRFMERGLGFNLNPLCLDTQHFGC